MVEMSYQREANVLCADYFECQGWHPPKEKMTKEDKQIIDRAVKEEWRIGDRTRLKRLLKKNLTLYRENVELEGKLEQIEKENEELKARYNRVDIIGYDALKNLTEAKDIIRELLFHITNDTFYVTFETQEQSVERARQFLRGIKEAENDNFEKKNA